MNTALTLNCDLGETDAVLANGPEHLAMPSIDMANIACGAHAGNPQVMRDTIALAKQHGVSIGAHPAYPDRSHFGRRSLNLSQPCVHDLVLAQISLLQTLCAEQGCTLSYVKPHGALYHDLLHDEATRHGVFSAVAALNPALPVLVLAAVNQPALLASASTYGLSLWFEAFADRRYLPSGALQGRDQADAVLTDTSAIIAQAKAIALGQPITCANGEQRVIHADSLCVHGDNPKALATLKAIRAALTGPLNP